MSAIDLDALEATARAATPGPWEFRTESPSMGGENYTIRQTGTPGIRMTGYVYGFGTGMIEHIATFDPPTVLALITRLREDEAVIEKVEALLPKWRESRAYNAEVFTTGGIGMMREIDYHGDVERIIARYKPTDQEGSKT